MKKKSRIFSKLSIITLLFSAAMIFASCEKQEGDGKVSLSITDAPIDEDGVSAVFITITGIEYQISGNAWQEFEEFEGPVLINLLELQNGKTELLGNFNAGAGTYTGLRFKLDAAVRGQQGMSNAGCNIEFEDGTSTPLFVPSGEQTGYKAVGTFTVPVNGTVEVTADFDLRKSVAKAGVTGMYILTPTIRIIVNNQAGHIAGNIADTEDGKNYVVFAYEAGAYNEEEAAEPAAEQTRFPNAVTSTGAEVNGDYKLAFLAEGNYDVVLTSVDADGEVIVLSVVTGISVTSNNTTTLNF